MDFFPPPPMMKGKGRGKSFTAHTRGPNSSIASSVDDEKEDTGKGKGGKGIGMGRRIFVTKIPDELTDGDLKQYFLQFGELDDLFVPLKNPYADGDHSHKNIAFVTFKEQKVFEEILQRTTYEVKEGLFIVVDKAMEQKGSKGKGKNRNSGSWSQDNYYGAARRSSGFGMPPYGGMPYGPASFRGRESYSFGAW